MLTTGIYRKVNIPGHSYVWNDSANNIVRVNLKETNTMTKCTLYEKTRLFQNKNYSMQEDDEVRSRNTCEICSWAHIYNSEIRSWNFDQKHFCLIDDTIN